MKRTSLLVALVLGVSACATEESSAPHPCVPVGTTTTTSATVFPSGPERPKLPTERIEGGFWFQEGGPTGATPPGGTVNNGGGAYNTAGSGAYIPGNLE
jgi:hypothetical protein